MSDNQMREIVERIKDRRNELGYTFQDMADLTGMSKSTLQRYEAGGIKNIPLDKLKVLSKALRVTPEWIMGLDETNESSVYYLDPEAAEIAQRVYERPELKILFDATSKVSKEDIEFVINMVDRMKKSQDGE